ncbi:MAG: universal stress protein [Planctomycetota bacterium]
MYEVVKILVPVSLTEVDETVLAWAAMIARTRKAKNLDLVHVRAKTDIPDEVLEQFPEAAGDEDEIRRAMEAEVEQRGGDLGKTEVGVAVLDGAPVTRILKHMAGKDYDLLITGIRPGDSGRLAVSMARKAPCSVLVVPQHAPAKVEEIAAAVDFSANSVDAVDVAARYAKHAGLKRIHLLHVFQVPLGYHSTGKSYEEFAAIMRRNAEREFTRFLERCETQGVEVECHVEQSEHVAVRIPELAQSLGADVLVIGARGRTALAHLLLGSVTEHILVQSTIPVIAVKKKGAGLSILQILLREAGLSDDD